jgi:hypothetical protein
MAKRSAWVWVGAAAAGACVLCSGGAALVLALGVAAEGEAAGGTEVQVGGSGAIPMGDTPDLFPGMPGWRPSGRGVRIPDASFSGAPRGLWVAQDLSRARVMLFLPDGTSAENPRLGGPWLFDVEGQRAQRGATGVGRFEVSGGDLTIQRDGFTSTQRLSDGSDGSGSWMALGQLRLRPVQALSRQQLVGTWNAGNSRYVFRADGTFESGQTSLEVMAGAARRGRWTLEGYLLMLEPDGAPGWITFAGSTGRGRLAVFGDTLYTRE